MAQILEFISSKVKGRISKRVFQENKVRQIFRKKNIFYAHVRVPIRGKEIIIFQKIWRALFSYNTRFEIPLLAYYRRVIDQNVFSRLNKWDSENNAFFLFFGKEIPWVQKFSILLKRPIKEKNNSKIILSNPSMKTVSPF